MEKGIASLVETCQEFGMSKEDILFKLIEKFEIGRHKAEEAIKIYWKE